MMMKNMRCGMALILAGLGMSPVHAAQEPSNPGEASQKARAQKLDLYEKHKAEYAATPEPALVKIGPAKYLAIAGQGEPSGPEFVQKVGALYAVAYGVKMRAMAGGRDYVVCALEGLYWGAKNKHDFVNQPRESWKWKLLIRTPEFITDQDVSSAIEQMSAGRQSEAVSSVALEKLVEGRCVQALHIGPYETEAKTLAAMMQLAKAKGLARSGLHHEIYLDDPRSTDPDKLRTILRQPVQ
ncbi:MAG: GyrI-like domain-containing protein [Phycisphaerae bacterium]